MNYRAFFDDELIPLVRRMADRARPGTPGDAELHREIRAMVWQGLTELRQSWGDTVELAEFLGTLPYQGPLLDTLTAHELKAPVDAAYALSVGSASVSMSPGTVPPGTVSPGTVPPGTGSPGTGSLDGTCEFVRFAAEVDYLVIVGGGPAIALVRADDPTLALRRHEETGRGELFAVTFAGTPVVEWLDPADWPQVLANARIRQAAYLVGLAQGALDLAVAHAKQRRQFGKPIGRFQALAFRLSELSMRIDAIRLLTRAASDPLTAAQSLASAADLARAVTTAAMQIHGAEGMTERSDAQLFYRRAAVESVWFGTPTQLRLEAVPLLEA